MQAGDLNHRITFMQDVTDGTTDPEWSPFVTVWANKQSVTGRVFYQAAAAQAESDVIYTIRFRADITAGMQIVDGNSTLTIKAPPVDITGKKQWLEIHAKEVNVNGS